MAKKKKITKQPPYAVVAWEDACVLTGRALGDVIKFEPMIVETTGQVFRVKGYICVRTHYGGDEISGCDDDWMRVPKKLVKSITYLEKK